MKTKLVLLLGLTTLVASAVLAGSAGATQPQHAAFARLLSDLTLRPGVAAFGGHPRVNPSGLYGAFDGTFFPRTRKLQYDMRWKALRGEAFRLVVRSRETGATYAVLCAPCRVRPDSVSVDGHPVSEAKGTAIVSRDLAYLMVGGYTFLELDTTAFPSGEIGGRVFGRYYYPGQPGVEGEPRCC